MKAKKWQRTVSLLLCLLMAMSFFVVTAPKAYAADGDSTEGLPHLTKFTVTTGYIYNKSSSPNVACKIKESAVSLKEKKENRKVGSKAGDFIGTIQITVEQPVKCTYNSSDKTTTTGDPISTLPTELVILSKTCAGEYSDESYKISTTTVKFAPKEEGSNVYTVKATALSGYPNIKAGRTYYYDCEIKIDTSARENTAPTIKAGLSNSLTVSAEANQPWRIDLSEIFEDAEGDTLTYTVSVNDAEAQSVNGSTYSYTLSEEATSATLVFKASDGALESEAYTVTLTKEAVTYHKITTSVDGSYQWNTVTRDMGKISASVEGGKIDSVRVGSTVKLTAEALKFELQFGGLLYDAQLSSWEVSGVSLDDAQKASDTLTFEMPDNDVTIKAVFVRKGSSVTLKANYADRGELNLFVNGAFNESNSTYSSESGHIKDVVQDRVIADASVSAELRAPYKQAFSLTGWTIRNETTGSDLDPAQITYTTKTAGGESYQAPTFKVDGKSEYSITAIFEAKDYGAVNVTVNDIKMGEATAQVDGGEASSSLTVVYEGVTVKLKATPKEGFIFKSWKASYGDGTQVTIADENAAETTFKMPQTDEKPVNVVAEFAVDPSYLSEGCALTDVTLLDNNDSSIVYYGNQDLTDFTIEVPADTDNAKLAGMILKLTVSENAQVFQDGSDTPWAVNGQACNMTLGTATKFVVRSQKDLAEGYEGPKQEYTITINRAKSTKCAIDSAKLGDIAAKIDEDSHAVTFTVPADTDESAVADMPLTFNCSQDASIKLKDAKENWDNGTACGMALNEEKTFVVTAEDGTTMAKYTVVIHRTPSDKKALTGATLGDIPAVIDEDSHAVTFTVPSDTTDSTLGEMILKFTCSPRAAVRLKDAATDWPDNGEACRLKLGGSATFVVTAEDTSTQEYTVTVNREKSTEKAITEAVLTKTDGTSVKADINEQNKTVTFTLPVGTTNADVAAMTLKFTCSQDASMTNWPADGQLCNMKLNEAKTFVVTAENGETQAYTVLITRGKSSAKEITDALLLAKADDTTSLATVKIDNTKKTVDFTLPVGTDTSKLGDMILKLTVSDDATVKKSGDTDNWPAAGKACGMELDKAATFTVTAENGETQDYKVTITRAKSSENEIKAALLLAKADDTTSLATVKIDNTKKTVDFTLPVGTDTSKLGDMILKLTVSDDATVKKSGDTDNWPAAGKACGMELDKAATFTVTAENGDKQNYKVAITRDKSSEKDITAAVLLNQTGDTTPFAKAQISETNIIFTLPSDTNKADLNSIGLKYLKLTYPESATAKMVDATGKDAYGDADGTAKWRNGDVKCNMSLNTPVKFVITAEDGSPKEYTVEIKYTAPAAPTLSGGSATRSSKTAATVKFTTNEAGTYYYKVVTHGATAPTVEEIKKSTTKGTASAGETSFTLSNLTTDARDVYIVVVSAAGGESAPLKVEIPAYDSGTDTPDTGAYKISVSTPKGGTITTNRTKADAGDEIIVTVIPDDGYQMEADSLTYTLAKDKGETVKITNNRFTMPACDVTITCKWETATTTAKGITAFSINGVAGAVNNTTNTITITMPRGTDVTKLTPTISTNGVKSLTPGSGETVNFTNSVTYTATMEDGSTKTYTVTVYVDKGTLADQFWDKLTDFVNQVPWWEYAKHQQSASSYPKYW